MYYEKALLKLYYCIKSVPHTFNSHVSTGENPSIFNAIPMLLRADFFYLLIYGIFFSDLGSGGLKKKQKKALKMTS